jgi:prolyl-tRNA synthetase
VTGVPLRVEVGVRDLAAGTVAVARRDRDGREDVAVDHLAGHAAACLDEVQRGMLAAALADRERRTLQAADRAELMEFLSAAGGFATGAWCGDPACEDAVQAESRATIRCLAVDGHDPGGPCLVCGRPGRERATWAQAY